MPISLTPRKLIPIFIDTIAGKNQIQLEAIDKMGFTPVLFEYDQGNGDFLQRYERRKLSRNPFTQAMDVFAFFLKNRRHIHHLEIYPGNIMAFYYVLLAQIFTLKTICVERGDLNYCYKGGYSFLLRLSMRLCYKGCSIVWYREPFMRPILEKMKIKRLFFLPNVTASIAGTPVPYEELDIDFLWLNRVIPQRKSAWFINALQHPKLRQTNNILVGILPQNQGKNLSLPNLIIEPYTSHPANYYRRARFFVLPAERVFANHALLEAMSHGVVPIISAVEGSGSIVTNGYDGFTFAHNEASFQKILIKANSLPASSWLEMSMRAKQKIASDFSPAIYEKDLQELYRLIETF